jgi:hypothetical protein
MACFLERRVREGTGFSVTARPWRGAERGLESPMLRIKKDYEEAVA